ncbi:hypothetical protein PQI66_11815 [Corynebacterium sp. USCH3]|uniref:LGFP repeat-containing protein n=1 Tax=Corynebacterium sp. USCH3 TaxID=3024840 RepID=UPI0030AA935C
MRINLKRTATVIAAGTLVLGTAACSDDDSSDTASETSATVESGSTSTEAADGAATTSDASESEAEGDSNTELPEGLQSAYDEAGGEHGDWGAVTDVESSDGATLATFENGWAVENADGDVIPLIGKIGETWTDDGGLDNEIGLPTGPESGDAMQGWTQQFENGTIAWMQDDGGNWDADIQSGQ